MIPEKLYRYESARFSVVVDAEREIYDVSKAKLYCREYSVTSETPKGYWIGYWKDGKDRWVSKTSRKRFAHPTKDEALYAYRQRKLSYVNHSKARLTRAEEDLALVEPEEVSNHEIG